MSSRVRQYCNILNYWGNQEAIVENLLVIFYLFYRKIDENGNKRTMGVPVDNRKLFILLSSRSLC